MKRSLNTVVYPAIVMAWLILLLGMFGLMSQYDFVHVFIIPLDLPKLDLLAHLEPGRYLLDLLLALGGVGIFAAACLAIGLLIIGHRSRSDANPVAIGATAFLSGEIVFSVVFLSAIVLYRLTPLLVATAFALALLAGRMRLVTFCRGIHLGGVAGSIPKTDKLIAVLSIGVLSLSLLYSSSILGYDSVVDYFSQPKMLAMLQRPVQTLPNDPYLVSSFQSGILYSAVIQLFGDQAARLISWLNGLALLAAGLAIAKETGLSVRARIWFLAMMCTSTAFIDLLGDGKVELISTVPLLVGAYWMLRSLKEPDRGNFALLGLVLGFAVIARPYNIFLTPIFVTAFYAIHLIIRKRDGTLNLPAFLKVGFWMVPPLLLLGAFHLLQNWLWLGNPLAPVIAGTRLNPAAWQWKFDPKLLNLYRLLYPLVVTFANSPQSLGNITPFFIGIAPFLLVTKARTALAQARELLWLALAGTITLAAWLLSYFTVVEIRYVLFVWAIFFLVIAELADIAATGLRLRAATMLAPMVLLSLLYMGVRVVLISLGSYSPVDSNGQAHCYYLDLCNFTRSLNQVAAPGDRVFVVSAYRYYLRPDLFACASRAAEYGPLESLAKQSSPDFWTAVYRAGFRYVTYESNYATFHSYFGSLPPVDLTPGWLHVRVISSTGEGIYGGEVIYELGAVNAPFKAGTYCQEDAAGIWEIRQVDPAAQE